MGGRGLQVWGDTKFSTEAIEVPNYSQQNQASKEKDRVGRAYSQHEFEKGVLVA